MIPNIKGWLFFQNSDRHCEPKEQKVLSELQLQTPTPDMGYLFLERPPHTTSFKQQYLLFNTLLPSNTRYHLPYGRFRTVYDDTDSMQIINEVSDNVVKAEFTINGKKSSIYAPRVVIKEITSEDFINLGSKNWDIDPEEIASGKYDS